VSDTWTKGQAQHLYALVYDDLHLCGCGQPDAAIDLIRRLLNLAPFYDDPAAVDAEFGGNAGAKHIVLSVLDDAGLIEHGGSITSSWPTAKGRAVRRLLTMASTASVDDLLAGVGYPHNGEHCPGECWAAWAPPEVDGDD